MATARRNFLTTTTSPIFLRCRGNPVHRALFRAWASPGARNVPHFKTSRDALRRDRRFAESEVRAGHALRRGRDQPIQLEEEEDRMRITNVTSVALLAALVSLAAPVLAKSSD